MKHAGRVRLALVGAGTMGQMYLQAFAQNRDAVCVAVCDTDYGRARRVAASHGVEGVYVSQDEMHSREEFDAVAVATPDAYHLEPVLRALGHGVHVLCEKPLALSVAECLRMAEMAEARSLRLMVNFGNRHRPEVRILRQEIERGVLGRVGHVHLRLNERIEKTRSLSWIASTNPTWFLHSHLVDLLTFVLEERVAEVVGRQRFGRVRAETGADVPDTMLYLLTMASGALVILESSWALPESFPSDVDIEITVLGEHGMIRTPLSSGLARYADRHATLRWDLDSRRYDGAERGWWYDSCDYFVHCLRTGEEPLPNARDATYVTEILEAMSVSVMSGQAVLVPA
jgi:predicted dehydrogenase